MPIARETIIVDPRGRSMDVTITDAADNAVTVYDAVAGGSAVSFPDTITSAKMYHLIYGGDYKVSAKIKTLEVAGSNGAKAVVGARYGVPVTVVPTVDAGAALDVAEGASSGGSSLIEFIATGADGNALPDGTDYYPDMTQVASVGVGISLGVDNQTFTLAAGTYDLGLVCGVLPTTDAGTLTVFFDGLPAPFDAPLITPARQATLCVFPVTIDGLILAAPTTTKLNLEHDGGGVFSIAKLHLCIRKVA